MKTHRKRLKRINRNNWLLKKALFLTRIRWHQWISMLSRCLNRNTRRSTRLKALIWATENLISDSQWHLNNQHLKFAGLNQEPNHEVEGNQFLHSNRKLKSKIKFKCVSKNRCKKFNKNKWRITLKQWRKNWWHSSRKTNHPFRQIQLHKFLQIRTICDKHPNSNSP